MSKLVLLTLVAAVALTAFACGGGNEGLTRAEAEQVVQAEVAAQSPAGRNPRMAPADVESMINDAISQLPQPEPGLTRAEVAEIVRSEMAQAAPPAATASSVSSAEVAEAVRRAMFEAPRPEPGPTRAEVEEIVRAAIASIPTESVPSGSVPSGSVPSGSVPAESVPAKSAPAEYTKYFVEKAVARYESQGLESTLAHYNSPQSLDGQWYVFIIDEDDLVIGHPDPDRLGLDLNGWVGTDANGYGYGSEMLSATEEGKWVSYVYRNPESGGIGSGDFELKNAWVQKHDGLLFGSGWYIDADEFTRMLVSVAVDNYRNLGLAGTMEYFASPGSVLAGLESAIAYYNAAETVDGQWFAFIGGPDGKIVGHSDITKIGGNTQALLGGEAIEATESGGWVESESLRVFVAGADGYLFGSGWSRDE